MPSVRPRDYREGIRIAVGQTWKFGYMVFLTTYRQPNCGEDLKSSDCTALLRLIICGGVDDGKSTLLARLLHESKMTGRRRFIAADTPDREQHTRDIVSGASTADLAISIGRQKNRAKKADQTLPHRPGDAKVATTTDLPQVFRVVGKGGFGQRLAHVCTCA